MGLSSPASPINRTNALPMARLLGTWSNWELDGTCTLLGLVLLRPEL